ncbi:hypothetical protein CCMA1212_010572 [Trichoderma ghanense]|uniref:Uncharacterized protein n=1 Tax=Trichoderma ghanense TaxID=65468 RepID=A0ABY2GP94_9HYPO
MPSRAGPSIPPQAPRCPHSNRRAVLCTYQASIHLISRENTISRRSSHPIGPATRISHRRGMRLTKHDAVIRRTKNRNGFEVSAKAQVSRRNKGDCRRDDKTLIGTPGWVPALQDLVPRLFTTTPAGDVGTVGSLRMLMPTRGNRRSSIRRLLRVAYVVYAVVRAHGRCVFALCSVCLLRGCMSVIYHPVL